MSQSQRTSAPLRSLQPYLRGRWGLFTTITASISFTLVIVVSLVGSIRVAVGVSAIALSLQLLLVLFSLRSLSVQSGRRFLELRHTLDDVRNRTNTQQPPVTVDITGVPGLLEEIRRLEPRTADVWHDSSRLDAADEAYRQAAKRLNQLSLQLNRELTYALTRLNTELTEKK